MYLLNLLFKIQHRAKASIERGASKEDPAKNRQEDPVKSSKEDSAKSSKEDSAKTSEEDSAKSSEEDSVKTSEEDAAKENCTQLELRAEEIGCVTVRSAA